MNPWEESWDTKAVKLSFDDALKAEGVTGKAADIARSIYQQESGSGKNTKTSNAGAVGGMQIIPSTFKSVAEKGWDINDPFDNSRAGIRYIKQLFEQAGGDPALTAAGYYGGPGGLEKARRGVAVSDPRNPNAPTTLQYGQQVAARLPKEPLNPVMAAGKAITDAIIPSANAAEPQAKLPWEEQWEAPPKVESKGALATANDALKAASDSTADIGRGFIRGAARIGNTIINSGTKSGADLVSSLPESPLTEGLAGRRKPNSLSNLVTGKQNLSPAEVNNMDRQAGLAAYDREAPNSLPYQAGDLAAQIAGTAGVGGALAAPLKAAGVLPRFASALQSGGMTAGGAPGAGNMLARIAGGGAAGGSATALVDPSTAGIGAAIGAALPPVVKGLGAAGGALARTVRGPEVPPNVLAAASQAQDAGYVIPPTQVKPTLGNRLLEGMSGKITTAQNASARNQEVTNRLARQAIGADELSPEGLAAVRSRANQAYTDLGNFGAIKADDAFAKTVRDAGQRAEGFAKDFPELVNKDTEQLIESFANKSTFDSQSAIEAIKRLREGQRTISGNPQASAEAKAFGRTQGKLADALEGLVERNLDEAGRPELLTAFRDARKTLARVYDVEKAMNPASGNVDARKLGNALRKGRLTEDLKTAAEFGQSFPKAAQAVEGMGSLPQLSPLDWASAGGISAATGSPLGALGLVARPAARAAALSKPVQKGLTRQGNLLSLSPDENVLLPLYRGGPLLATDR